MQGLGIDGLRLVWQIINFLILLFILQRVLFKPILRLMDKRADSIRESVDEAERMRQFAEETRRKTEALLDDARHQANEIVEGSRRIAEQYEASEKDRARREAELLIERAKDEIQLERDRAVSEVRQQAVDLAILAAGKVIEQQLNVDQHRQLVTQFLAEAAPSGNGH